MSYSFSITAESKSDALAQVRDKMAGIVQTQPFHDVDQAQAIAAAEAFIGLLPDASDKGVVIHMLGSGYSSSGQLQSVGINVTASLVNKAAHSPPPAPV